MYQNPHIRKALISEIMFLSTPWISPKIINIFFTWHGLITVNSVLPAWNFTRFGLLISILYVTFGDVIITDWLNSFSNLSLKISMWSKPRNPILYPEPRAGEASSVRVTDESFRINFSTDFLRRLNLFPSSG